MYLLPESAYISEKCRLVALFIVRHTDNNRSDKSGQTEREQDL